MSRTRDYLSNMDPVEKHIMDLGAVGLAGASLVSWLPSIAAAVSIIWLSVRIYEYTRWVYRGRIPKEKP